MAISHLTKTETSAPTFWPLSFYKNSLSQFCKTSACIVLLTILFVLFGFWSVTRALDSFRASYYIREGRVWAEQESDFANAALLLERALSLDPENGLAHYYLGGYYARRNRMDDALREYALAVKNYNDFHINYNLGQIYFMKQDYAKAEEYYKKAISQNSSLYECHKQLGLIYGFYHKDYARGIAELKQYLQLDKTGTDIQTVQNVITQFEKLISSDTSGVK